MWNKMNSANGEQYEPLDESPLGELDCPHREGSDAAATALDLAEIIYSVEKGCIMRRSEGIAGETADGDVFLEDSASSKKWIYILWDKSPEDWIFLESDTFQAETDLCNGDILMLGENIYISMINEVFLELEPSTSFRIYIGKEVIKLTPLPESRMMAANWVDALFSAMKIQSLDPSETVNLKERWLEFAAKREEEYNYQRQVVLSPSSSTEDDYGQLIPPSDNHENDNETKKKKRMSVQLDLINIYGGSNEEDGSKKCCCNRCSIS